MKMYYNYSKWTVILGFISLITVSCTNKKNKDEIPSSTDKNIAIRSLGYIDEEKIITVNKQANSDRNGTNGSEQVNFEKESSANVPLHIMEGSEFDFTTDIQSTATAISAQSKASLASSTKAATKPFSGNKKFRLLFLPEGSSTPIYNGVLNAGEDPELRVAANKKYNWYAFSINEDSNVPNIDGSGNISASDLANKDFMFASGEITTKEDQNYLDILFIRQMSAIDVTINTRGIFGDITDNSKFTVGTGSGSSFINIIQTGTYNIFNSTFSNFEDTEPVEGAKMTIVDSRWKDAEKVARFYTANTSRSIPANSLRVRLNNLGITLDNKAVRNFSANTIVPITHAQELKLTKGTLSKTNVRLIESGIKVGKLTWARTNATYNENKLYGGSYQRGASDAYRFVPDNENAYPNVNIHLWNFGTATPMGKDYANLNPCGRVYPEGTWKLPQELNDKKEFTDLINIKHTTSIKKVSNGTRYAMIWKGEQPANPAYPDQDLILTYLGFRNEKSVLDMVPSNNGGTGVGMYRTNSYSGSRKAIIFCGPINKGTFSKPLIDERPYAEGTSIRCVRATL